jgi:hypothetical protein
MKARAYRVKLRNPTLPVIVEVDAPHAS